MRSRSPAVDLADRLCRPQRVGIVGHRGVGKTTLLTMLYREAVGGRLPGLRLAAADARTATYLADQIVQLEAGQPLPATLAETELRFHLYHQNARIELVFLDYQGEHITLGRHEAVHDFLRGCDAVWLCLDASITGDPAARWQAEQEVEQVVEDYLGRERGGAPHRPMALLVTRADLLGDPSDALSVGAFFEQQLSMTRHTLDTHCTWHAVFAVSSLGRVGAAELHPVGLEGPLTWLACALRAQDEARLDQLWQSASGDLNLLDRATRAFARRYPDDPVGHTFQKRLFQQRWRRRGRRALAALLLVASLTLGVFVHDTVGAGRVRAFAQENADDPEAVRAAWEAYRRWHPTRHLTHPRLAEHEREQIAELDRVLRQRQRDERLAELRRYAADPDADPEAVWADFARFRQDYPEYDLDADARQLRERIKQASDARRAERERQERVRRERSARLALRELDRSEQSASLAALVEHADRLLAQFAGSAVEAELQRRRTVYLARQDERDFDTARDYSTRYPTNFYTRRQRYQQYLDRHPRGAFAVQARTALERIAADWDRHDFRSIADHYRDHPADVKELRLRCRNYLAAHPAGRFRDKAVELQRWCDRVSEPGEYQIVLKSGSFSKKVAHLISRGPSLSVELEVAGVRYGPSSIVQRSYEPEWDYEFPRRVRWKLGDPVRIIVTDHYFWRRRVADVTLDDPLALVKLTGEVEVTHGSLEFRCDLAMPVLPKPE